jgi:hypothetical protein
MGASFNADGGNRTGALRRGASAILWVAAFVGTVALAYLIWGELLPMIE